MCTTRVSYHAQPRKLTRICQRATRRVTPRNIGCESESLDVFQRNVIPLVAPSPTQSHTLTVPEMSPLAT